MGFAHASKIMFVYFTCLNAHFVCQASANLLHMVVIFETVDIDLRTVVSSTLHTMIGHVETFLSLSLSNEATNTQVVDTVVCRFLA